MGGTSIDKNPVCRLGVILPTIGVYDLDVLQASEVIASAGSKLGVNLDSGHTPSGAHDLCQNRRVVPSATANVYNVLPFLQIQCVDEEG